MIDNKYPLVLAAGLHFLVLRLHFLVLRLHLCELCLLLCVLRFQYCVPLIPLCELCLHFYLGKSALSAFDGTGGGFRLAFGVNDDSLSRCHNGFLY